MLFATFILFFLPFALAFADPVLHEQSRRSRAHMKNSLAKRQTYSGRATYYAVGLGACGWYNSPGDYIVALNTAQYGGGYPGPNCGRSITISANGVQVVAQIADQCPSCGYGDLDLSEGLFKRFASTDAGVFQMNWWYNDGNSQPQPTTTEKPTPTSTWTPPTSTYTPPTSTYVAPTSTYTPPTSTYTPPASTAPSTTAEASTTSFVPSTSILASTVSPSGLATNGTVLPLVVTSDSSNSTASATGSAGASEASGSPAAQSLGNLALFNQAVTYLGNIVVVGAGGR